MSYSDVMILSRKERAFIFKFYEEELNQEKEVLNNINATK